MHALLQPPTTPFCTGWMYAVMSEGFCKAARRVLGWGPPDPHAPGCTHRGAADALPAPEPLDVEILAEDTLLPAGHISALIGPTIVVQVRGLMHYFTVWALPYSKVSLVVAAAACGGHMVQH